MPLDDFVLYLDENIHNCQPILNGLDEAGIRYERHGNHFAPGTHDEQWLPLVGRSRWLLVTLDKNIRYNELERRAVLRFGVRQFVFTSGNLSGHVMALLLVKAFPEIVKICQRNDPPFIASITKSGAVHLRFDRFGSVHGRKKKNSK